MAAKSLPFLKKQMPKDAFLVLDIGTKILKAVIFSIENEKIRISGYGKEVQKFENYQKDIKRLADLCKVAIFRAQRQAHSQKIKGVILGFGGGFVRGETFSQKFFRDDPQKYIDSIELKNILQKFQWRIKEEICRRPEEALDSPPKLLQSWICEARVDGYQVANPFDFQGKEILLSVFNSYCSPDFFNFLEEFTTLLKIEILGIFNEDFAVYETLLHKKIPNFGGILIDVGGFHTQVSLIRKGNFEKSVGFDIGGQNFTDVLIKSFGVSEIEAEDIKVKYENSELGFGVARKIAKIFEPIASLWYNALNLALEEFPFQNYLPSQIYLFGGGALLPEVRDGLIKKKAKEFIPNLANFKTEILTPVYFGERIEEAEIFNSPQNTIPLSLALFFSSVAERENIFEKILKQTLRIIQ